MEKWREAGKGQPGPSTRRPLRYPDIYAGANTTQSRDVTPRHLRFDDEGKPHEAEANPQSVGTQRVYRYLQRTDTQFRSPQNDDYVMHRSWKSEKTLEEADNAIKEIALKTKGEGHTEFDTIHHTYPKGPLAEFYDRLTDKQKADMAAKLDVDLTEGRWTLANLYSNLTVGPNADRRTDDPRANLDPIYYKVHGLEQVNYGYNEWYGQQDLRWEPKITEVMDPRSAAYQNFLEKVEQNRIDDAIEALARAERIHIIIEGGYKISRNVAMWKLDHRSREWGKEPISISEHDWNEMLSSIKYYENYSIADLKRSSL